MGRHRLVVGMMIAVMIAASGCITAERPAAQVAADPVGSPRTVTCEDGSPFGRDTSHKKLVASFGASNVEYQKLFESLDSTTALSDPTGYIFISWRDDKRRSRPKEIAISSSRWSVGGKLRVGMSLQQVQSLNGKPFRVDQALEANAEGYKHKTDWRGGALERLGGCRLGVEFGHDESDGKPSEEDYGALGEVLSDDPKLPPFNPTVSGIYMFY